MHFAEWNLLPKDKSLFGTKEGCGLPIGNLTSQVFANFFLSEYDHYVKHVFGIKCYVRYVDDCEFVHKDKGFLRYVIRQSMHFLQERLHVSLYPKKIFLKSAYDSFEFLGTFIKPDYTVCGRRVKNCFVNKLKYYSEVANNHKFSKDEKQKCLASINSYLGIMVHYKTYVFRKT